MAPNKTNALHALRKFLDTINTEFSQHPQAPFLYLDDHEIVQQIDAFTEEFRNAIGMYKASDGYYVAKKRWVKQYPMLYHIIIEERKKQPETKAK